jgi:serine protease Do
MPGAPAGRSTLRDRVKGLTHGLVVERIQENGPAIRSDLKSRDIITEVEDQPVTSVQELRDTIRSRKIGSTITLNVVRLAESGEIEKRKIEVKTEAWPEEEIPALAERQSPESDSARNLGLTVRSLTDVLATKFEVKKVDGVIVTEVDSDSPAANEGFQPGDIVTHVGRKPVTTAKQFRDAVNSTAAKGAQIDLVRKGVSEVKTLKEKKD